MCIFLQTDHQRRSESVQGKLLQSGKILTQGDSLEELQPSTQTVVLVSFMVTTMIIQLTLFYRLKFIDSEEL